MSGYQESSYRKEEESHQKSGGPGQGELQTRSRVAGWRPRQCRLAGA